MCYAARRQAPGVVMYRAGRAALATAMLLSGWACSSTTTGAVGAAPVDAQSPDIVDSVDVTPDIAVLTDAAPDAAPSCPAGLICPTKFPFAHDGDTAKLGPSTIDSYSCKPGADESGPEQLYRVDIPEAGFLSAAVYDGDGVDVDVHLLTAPDGKACLSRGHHHAGADVKAGVHYIAVDTFTKAGKPFAGAYTVHIGFIVPSKGPCGLQTGVMKRVKDGGKHLPMPALGPIVKEAHLVTREEPPPYPSTSTEELKAHYALSQSRTKFVMHRQSKWAPLEGGSFYGAGIGSPKFLPVIDEGWYVNMYWTKAARPDRGTPMILRLASSSRAVVVSAGHETGPGNLAHIGGTPEETHFYMGTGHLSPMWIGLAKDAKLPFGPRICTDKAPTKPTAPGCPQDMVAAVVEVGGKATDVCVDRYEAPNVPGGDPLVMYSFDEAAKWCKARGKRLCYDDEWTGACQGKAATKYPYGDVHKPGTCNDDAKWKAYSQAKLNGWPWNVSTPDVKTLADLIAKTKAVGGAAKAAAEHVMALYQGAGSGSHKGCTNAVGAMDMCGNVEEWTRRRDGGKAGFHGNLKGRYWADVRTCQDNIKSHGDGFRFYEIGFRCCADGQLP